MRKLITKERETELINSILDFNDLANNTQNIKLEFDQYNYIDLHNLNLNIVKYDMCSYGPGIDILNCNINKLILNNNNERSVRITNSSIQDIYIKSEVDGLSLVNTPLPNFHGRVDLIDKIQIDQ